MTKKQQEWDQAEYVRRLEALFDREGVKLVKDALWEQYNVAHEKKLRDLVEGRRGFGIRVNTPMETFHEEIDQEAADEAVHAIQAIRSRLEYGAALAFKRILGGVLTDPVLRKRFVEDSAKLVGKGGGRPEGEAPHIQWLRERLEVGEKEDPRPTAKEHYSRLKNHADVEEVDSHGIHLAFDTLASFGYVWREGKKEPRITLDSVRRMLTNIRNGT